MDWIKRIKGLIAIRGSKKKKRDRVLADARKGDLLSIKSLIRDEINVKEFGQECLMAACESDHDEIVSYLIKRGVDTNKADDGFSALHKCVDNDSPKCTKLLVDNGAQVDARFNGVTPLMMTCDKKYALMMELIFQSPSCTRAAKIVALEHMGARFVVDGDFQGARGFWSRSLQERLLAEPGDLVEAKSELAHPVYGNQFHTAEDLDRMASSEEDMWMQALIIMERIKGHHAEDDYYCVVWKACDYLRHNYRMCISIQIYILDRQIQLHGGLNQNMSQPLIILDDSILSIMSKLHHTPEPYEVVMPVLKKGVLWTELAMNHPMAACIRSKFPGFDDVILLVLDSIAVLSTCQQKMSEVDRIEFKQLISKFVLLKPRYNEDISPLHAVLFFEYIPFQLEMVKLLLEAGSDPGVADSDGYTPMHYACREHDPPFPTFDIVHLLLQAGANPQAVNRNGNTPLHLMAMVDDPNNREVIDLMLSHCCSCIFHIYNTDGKLFTDYLSSEALHLIDNPSTTRSLQCSSANALVNYEIPYNSILPTRLTEFVDMHSIFKSCP